jgi:hypothetical protein
MATETAPRTTKRPWWRKWKVIIPAAVVVVVIIAMASSPDFQKGVGAGVNDAGNTPTPTATESSTPTKSSAPTPVPTPTLAFKPITLTGVGSKVPKFVIPEDAPAIATITERGTSNFVVTSLAADGSSNELLVNEIGNYAGTRLFDANAGQHSVAFKVESNGSWTIVIKPVTLARAWDPAKALSGKGADVVRVVPPTSGLTTVTITHRGSSNFAVMAYTADGGELLVNEIGNYSGEVPLPDGTLLLSVEADGVWTVTP